MTWRQTIGAWALLAALVGCAQPLPLPLPALGAGAQSTTFAKVTRSAGLPTQNFAQVHDSLFRGGQTDDESMKLAKQMGIRMIVNLQGAAPLENVTVAREKANAEKLGIGWVNIRIPFKVEVPKDMVNQWLTIAANPANQPCYVHCYHGRDRTGTMVAAYRIKYDHFTNTQAFDEMKTFGFNPKKYPEFAAFVQSYKP
jgi:protein tyrosine/serine phosphatase